MILENYRLEVKYLRGGRGDKTMQSEFHYLLVFAQSGLESG